MPAKIKVSDALFLPYQKRWVEDRSRLKIAEKSRQIGFTWATAYAIVRMLSLISAAFDYWVSSRDKEQATLFIEDIKKFAALLKIAADDLGEQVLDEAKGSTGHIVRFASGHRVISLSSNPDAQAGKRGTRILDEFALHPDPKKLYSIAFPGITWGGSMEIFSTHRGTHNYFNQLLNEIKHKGNPKKFSLHTITLQTALEQGFLAKLQEKLCEINPDDERLDMDEADYFNFIRSGCPDEETFLEEYMCVPSDDDSAFLSHDLITSALYPPNTDWQTISSPTNPLYIGVDIGRKHDLTVICVIEKNGSNLYLRELIPLDRQPYHAQRSVLYPLIAHTQTRRVCIDATGIGNQFSEEAQIAYGSYRVEPTTFTAQVKETLAIGLKLALEDHRLHLPDDSKLRSDLRGIRKSTTTSGNTRYAGERNAEGHCDRFWALALAVHAATDINTSGAFTPENIRKLRYANASPTLRWTLAK